LVVASPMSSQYYPPNTGGVSMKNTGVTLITGLVGSGKTTLINLFIANRGQEKIHVFIEEDGAFPLDSFGTIDGVTVTPFLLGHEEFSSHDVDFSTLMDLAREALAPTQFLCELKDIASLPRVLLELTRAGVVNVRIVMTVNDEIITEKSISEDWFKTGSASADAIWCPNPTKECTKLLNKNYKEKVESIESEFSWFPVLKGWKNPVEILNTLVPFTMEHDYHTLEFSGWGWFNMTELTNFLQNDLISNSRLKGAIFCKEPDESEIGFYTLSGNNGEFTLGNIDFKEQMEKFMDEGDLIDLLDDSTNEEEPYIDGTFLRSNIQIDISKSRSLDDEMLIAKTLESIWHFQVPWNLDDDAIDPALVKTVLDVDMDNLETDESITLCHEGLKTETPMERAPYHEKLGIIQRELEDVYSALTHSRFAIALDSSPEKFEEMARCCNNLDNYPYAILLLEKALELDPDNKSALQNIIRLHLVYGHPKEGLSYLDRVMKIDSKDFENILLGSYLYFETDNYQKLIDLYESHKEECDESEDFLLTLSSLYLDHSDSKNALVILNKLLVMDSSNDGIMYLMGYAHLLSGEMIEAEKALLAAIDMGNRISWVYLALGLSLEYLGKKQDGHSILLKAFETAQEESEEDPTYQPFVEVSILTHIATGKTDQAQQILESSGRDMTFSHEFKNFIKLLSCFKLPKGL
jgi:tetratricopeptide (TPR) repeat protein